MSMLKCVYGLTDDNVDQAFEILKERPKFGLPEVIKDFEKARDGCTYNDQRVDYWVTIGEHQIALSVEELPTRPKRKWIKKLISGRVLPTVLIYAHERLWSIVRKVAKSIQLGLNIIRHRHELIVHLRRLHDSERMLMSFKLVRLDEPKPKPDPVRYFFEEPDYATA